MNVGVVSDNRAAFCLNAENGALFLFNSYTSRRYIFFSFIFTQVNFSSSKKAISLQACARARTKESNTETNLRRLALGGQTWKNLRSLVCKFELDQNERKS